METRELKLRIYPCVDSLLYFPIYLAIDIYRRNLRNLYGPSSATSECKFETNGNTSIWHFGHSLQIQLLEPPPRQALEDKADGEKTEDEQTVNSLVANPSEDTIDIAVADPMVAFEKNRLISQSGGDVEKDGFKVIGTFIDRIALWGVGFYPDNRGRKRQELSQLYQLFLEDKPPLPSQLDGRTIAYCGKGHTTSQIVRYFFKDVHLKSITDVDFGEDEIELIFHDPKEQRFCHVSFTNVPWLAKQLHDEKHSAIRGRPLVLFPFLPAPFPFSSIMTRAANLHDKERRATIARFLLHLMIAVAVAYRAPIDVADRLVEIKKEFRQYGLSLGPTWFGQAVESAVSKLIYQDCLCEQLMSSWTSWDFTFSIKYPTEEWPDLFGLWNTTTHDEFVTLTSSEVTSFLNANLRYMVNSYRKPA